MSSVEAVSMRPNLYHGWPTMTRRRNGELLVVTSGGRESHVCPFGWVELMRSKDEGRTWSYPCVLLDSPVDDRDAGVLETAKGTLLVTTFTSVGYEARLAKAEGLKPGQPGAWPEEKLRRWQAAHQQIGTAEKEVLLGTWLLRSTDGGASWSAPYRSIVDGPMDPSA